MALPNLNWLKRSGDRQKLEQEQQKRCGGPPHVLHDLGGPLLTTVDEIVLLEKPAIYNKIK